jgi:preprotein translocase subunit SecD
MSKRLRLGIILVFVGIAVAFLMPTLNWHVLLPEDERQLATSSRDQIRIVSQQRAGADLQTLRTLYEGDPDASIPEDLGFLRAPARDQYRFEGKPVPSPWTVERLLDGFPSESTLLGALESDHRQRLLELKELTTRSLQLGLDLQGGMYVLIEPDFEELAAELGPLTDADRQDALARALEILNNRIDQFGLTEPSINQQGDDYIIVELPGAPDPERMRNFIVGKGRLGFHLVDPEGQIAFDDYQRANPGNFLAADGSLRDSEVLPAGTVLRGVYEKDTYEVDQLLGYAVIKEKEGLSGEYISDSRVDRDPITGRPEVLFFLGPEGGDIFFKLTQENVGEVLAVVLDDRVKARAQISQAIRQQVRVTGFTQREAEDLALVLRTGSLPVPLDIVSQQQIGAGLGEDAIRASLRAVAVGALLVFVFMVAYYRGAGLIADLVLALNLFFVVSILSVLGFTLTLPSIAGVILTVGMAVDANVIIFERIKEELRAGKSPAAAVRAGFAKAFRAVLDANITTFIAAVVLSQISSGPIQGFAVTLSVGILSSMFTALVVARLIFDFMIEVLRVERLSLGWTGGRERTA